MQEYFDKAIELAKIGVKNLEGVHLEQLLLKIIK